MLRYSEVIFGSLGGPKGARKEAGFQLGKVQAGLVPTDWKPFDDVGAGTRAIRIRDASGIYRGMRVAKFEEAVYVLHCFEKKTQWPASRTRTLLRRAIAQWSARGNEMKIDTEIHHVTRPGANLLLELVLTPDEAQRLQATSRKQINDTRLLKHQLMEELSCLDCETSLEEGRGRPDSDGLAPACVQRGE